MCWVMEPVVVILQYNCHIFVLLQFLPTAKGTHNLFSLVFCLLIVSLYKHMNKTPLLLLLNKHMGMKYLFIQHQISNWRQNEHVLIMYSLAFCQHESVIM